MALAFVQSATIGNTTTGTTAAGAITTTSGNLLVVSTSDDSALTTNGMSVTDNKGNTFTKVLHQGNSSTLSMWYCANIVGGASHIVTATWTTTATGRCTVAVQEFSGVSTTSPLDVSVIANSTGTTVSSGASATTAQADELIVGGVSRAGTNTGLLSQGTGYSNFISDNQSNAGIGQESKIVAATGTQTATFFVTLSRICVVGLLSFKQAGGTPPPTSTAGSSMLMMGI